MLIADLTAVRLYNYPSDRLQGTMMGHCLDSLYQSKYSGDTRGTTVRKPPASLTQMVDTNVVCVLPKMRIAAVGSTLRNATRNLSLLPGRGEMRCSWDMTAAEPMGEDEETLDILLIPAPFSIDATDFEVIGQEGHDRDILHNNKPNWGNFKLKQPWIDKALAYKFIKDCCRLLAATKKQTRSVNAVILPEYALSYETFERLCDALKKNCPSLEFVLAGASSNCDGQKANTLLTRVWARNEAKNHITNSRRKHHRWRLDRAQVEAYGLSSVLTPSVSNWWESSIVGQREMQFHRFRKDSAFAALICEELARSDTCHDILRSVGPNLVFALLMDSAQIPVRWPGQYAAALSDDPGCAVLSFTSNALVERSNFARTGGSKSVALWRDEKRGTVTMDMPDGKGARGILLSLWSEIVKDQTIFGKRSAVRAWRYANHVPIHPLQADPGSKVAAL